MGTAYLLKRPLGVLMGCLCIMVMGLIAYGRMPMNLRPRSELPVLTITTTLGETGPQEIETIITKPIEEAVADIAGIRRIESISSADQSRVLLVLHHGRSVAEAALEVRGRLRRAWSKFPADARFPVLTRANTSNDPLAVLSVTGLSSMEECGHWVDRVLKPRLTRINGVAAVQVAGAPHPQIIVDCDQGRLRALGLTVQAVARAIKTGHRSLPAGFVTIDGERIAVRTTGRLDTVEAIAGQWLSSGETGSVRVDEVAHVRTIEKDPDEIVRFNGRSLISVAIYRAAEGDLKGIWQDVRSAIDEARSERERAPEIEVVFSQAEELEKTLDRLAGIVPVTVGITCVVLFVFLGTITSTLVVMAAVPFSLLVAMLVMRGLGLSLDPLSMSGLTLGLGILVDNAIVVIEAVFRQRGEGVEGLAAVAAGTEEVGPALCLSTFTTVIVFLPVTFVSQEVRLFFTGLAWSVSSSLMASLVASLILIPVLLSMIGRRKQPRLQLIKAGTLARPYGWLLAAGLRHRFFVVLLAVGTLAAAGYLAKDLSFRQGFGGEDRSFRIFMIMPPGMAKSFVDAAAAEAEKRLMGVPGVHRVHVEISSGNARFTVGMDYAGQKGESTSRVMERLKNALPEAEHTAYHVLPMGEGGDSPTISLNIQGPAAKDLDSAEQEIVTALRKVQGLKDVVVRHGNPIPIIECELPPGRVGFDNLQTMDIAYQLRSFLTGPVTVKALSGEKVVDVRVRASRDVLAGVKPLEGVTLPNEKGEMIPLAEVLQTRVMIEPSDLNRENRRPVSKLTLVLDKDSPLEVSKRVEGALEALHLPIGFDYHFGDDLKDIVRVRKEMLTATVFGLILIYLGLIAATESLLQPIVIMSSVPLAAAGVIFGLKISGTPVAMPVYLGMVILCGLVVNVNIVMVYTINSRLRSGLPLKAAIMEGSLRRLRPILMTVATAVCGSLPMLLDKGTGSSLWSPLALTLTCGMIAAGGFSLILTPIFYSLLEGVHQRASGGSHPPEQAT